MKHILNNLSEEEKNSIREQHTGGMKVMTENFSKLLNSKLGNSKPFLAEQQRAADTIEGGGMGINEVMGLAYDFMNENCPEGPKDKMKYQECIGRLHDLFGMVIRNLKGNISDSREIASESNNDFVAEQTYTTKGVGTAGQEYDIKSPFKVGQVLTNIIRSIDKKPYTIKITQVGNGFVVAKIKGPGTYEGKAIDGTGTYELNTNTPKKLMGNNELGNFMIP